MPLYLYYVRIPLLSISGMIEHVGHEYMDEFFACCESRLAEDGILVVQVSSAGQI
jgi:cyclopropane fatty-acyl-phospholipid synthase-like methyltransferase